MKPSPIAEYRARVQRKLIQFTWGGEWAIALPARIKHNLYWFFFDGLFASASENIAITYLVLYILALGANRTQIGLMNTFSSLTAAALLFPGALLVERFGHRKELTMLFGGGLSRLVLLSMAFLPLIFGGQALVWAAISLSVARDSFGNLAFPPWMSVTGDIVPLEGRGRYFGSRNFIMGVAGMLAIFFVGELITRTGQPFGFQLAIGLAFIIGGFSTFSFSHLKDPDDRKTILANGGSAIKAVLMDVKTHPIFLSLCLVMMVWNFSVNIAGPFFTVFMVQNLKLTATMIGITSIVTTISSLLIQRRIGKLADRWGPRRVQMLSMLLIPIAPIAWVFVTQFWHVIAVNAFSGALWGAFNLVSFNLLLSVTPDLLRARYAALFQIMITLALAGGAAFGTFIITNWGYHSVFLFSAIGRIIAALLFIRFVPDLHVNRT